MRVTVVGYILCVCSLFLPAVAVAQNQSMREIERQKESKNKEIKETTKEINRNKTDIRRTLRALDRIAADINAKQNSIGELNKQMAAINLKMALVNKEIARNDSLLSKLRNNYLVAIKKMRSHRSSGDRLMFLFSSESFHQAYRRMRYLKEFSRWREQQTGEIKKVQQKLDQEKRQLLALQKEKANAINEINSTKLSLEGKRSEQNRIVASLREKGTELNQVLREQEEEARALDRQLNKLIEAEEQKAKERARIEAEKRKKAEQEQARKEEEARKAEEERIRQEKEQQEKEAEELRKEQEKQKKKSEKKRQEELRKKQKDLEKRKEELRKKEEQLKKEREEAQRKEEERNSERYTMDDEEYKLSGSFASNKGKLPYPVTGNCRIVRRFGRQKHPELKYVETDNPGIDIEASQGAQARAVFDGKVSAIFQQPGYNNIVMVRHGNYLTIYAGLANIYVKTGDTLKMGQAIGVVFTDKDDENRALLHFEIRKEREKLNPELWLK